MNRHAVLLALACLLPLVAGCRSGAKSNPTATGTAAGPSPQKPLNAKRFVLDPNESKVSFLMNAPSEKIRGRAFGATTGDVFLDPTDLSRTTGTIAVDLDKLELFQRVKEEGAEDFASEVKSEKQNEEARDWLQINDKTSADERKKFARAEYRITTILSASQRDVTRMSGGERTVQIKAEGTLSVHGQTKDKVATDLAVTFKLDGDNIVSVVIKTKTPLSIGLADFDIKPRDPLGAVLEKGLDALAAKVSKDAPIELLLVMKPDGAPLSATPPEPDPTPLAPAGSASASASAAAGPPGVTPPPPPLPVPAGPR